MLQKRIFSFIIKWKRGVQATRGCGQQHKNGQVLTSKEQ